MKMEQKRNTYSKEFKEQAVAMLNSGKSGKQVEAELGLSSGLVYRWRSRIRGAGEQAFAGNGNERDQELARLRRELAQAQEERDILRKAHEPSSRIQRHDLSVHERSTTIAQRGVDGNTIERLRQWILCMAAAREERTGATNGEVGR